MVSTGTQLWRIYIIHMLCSMHVVLDQAGQPVVASQPAKQSLQPSVRHQNCASMVGLPAEQSPTEDLTIPHADKDADSELDAQFEYSDVSDDDNKVPLNVTDDDSDDTVEDVHDFHFLDDCAEDSTNVTGAQTSAEHPEGASVTSSPDPASETSECVLKLFKELKLKLAKLVKTHPNFNI
ncbi:uncharacterized protein [Littorina saxatilis]|uniref:uncharacterized protein isoform X3 n=1 Tax=Littorina saxatilis TaxID=31220 RepID=UPI0038B549EC